MRRGILSVAGGMVCLIVGGIGCSHLGPQTLRQDRADYSEAVAASWKQQTLLNIVKLRYMDLPVFMDISQIVSGYSLETSVNLGGQLSSAGAIQGDNMNLGAAGRYTDRPTISYSPLTGEKFLRGLITPIAPKHIFSLIQSGYPADFILGLMVESLNGVHNRSVAPDGFREADPDFIAALKLIREVQSRGVVGVRIEQTEKVGETTVLFFRQDTPGEDVVRKLAEIRRLLQLPSGQHQFRLTYSPVRGGADELTVGSRSMLQIMTTFASFADVPQEHLDQGRAYACSPLPQGDGAIKISCTREKPTVDFTAVRYRDYWFWIDDRDLPSKRAFTAIMFFFTLAETSTGSAVPMITIPAQ